MEIYRQGAESKIYHTMYSHQKAIVKERFSKQYRNKLLDQTLRKERTKAESKAILKCKQGGIVTPTIYSLDLNDCKITMENINGQTVNDYLTDIHNNGNDVKLLNLFLKIGTIVAKMHSIGVFHGDLTTSNILIKEDDTLVLIDFGLSHFNPSIEDKAVDIYVMERAFISTHSYFTNYFAVILDGYKKFCDSNVKSIIDQYNNVRARGRKREMIG